MPKTLVMPNDDGDITVGPLKFRATLLGELLTPELSKDPKSNRYMGVTGSGIVLSDSHVAVMVPVKDHNGVSREVQVKLTILRPAITEAEDSAVKHNVALGTAAKDKKTADAAQAIKTLVDAKDREILEARKAEIAAYQSSAGSIVDAVSNVAAKIASSVATGK